MAQQYGGYDCDIDGTGQYSTARRGRRGRSVCVEWRRSGKAYRMEGVWLKASHGTGRGCRLLLTDHMAVFLYCEQTN